jgi:O-antigen/teichoic acid export membrane protein
MFNWAAMLVGMLVQFFLSPFTVHHLGNLVYSVWILVVSTVAYFNLLDLGLRSAIVRFVSKGYTQGLHEDAQKVVCTALWLRIGIGAVIIVLGTALAIVFPRLFTIPSELRQAACISIVLIAASLAITLASGVPGAVLAAIHRFDLLSSVNILRAFVRTVGFVWLLRHGHGIVALAAWELFAAAFTGMGLTLLCWRTYPELRSFFGPPDMEVMRKIWGYSVYIFVGTIGGAIVYHTDNIVVGMFVTTSAVTFFAIAGNLVMYSREVLFAMSSTFVPLASGFEAEGKNEKLRHLLIQGTRASLLLFMPVCIALFFRGHTFISLWMGPEYAVISGTLLQILLLNQVLAMANITAGGIAYGMEKHRLSAIWAIFEAIANLTLSILLVRRMGIYGVAWGTVIPGIFINLICWPCYVATFLDISPYEYMWKGWGYVALAAVPYGMACRWEEQHLVAHNLALLFIQIIAILPVFLLASILVFWKEVRPHLFRRMRWA